MIVGNIDKLNDLLSGYSLVLDSGKHVFVFLLKPINLPIFGDFEMYQCYVPISMT